MFMDEILKHKNNQNIKVLLLSATPINNNLNDIRNQYYLMVKEQDDGFYETLDIRNLTYEFKRAQTIYMDWCAKKDRKVSDLKLPDSFRKLTDNLTVARTRTMVLSIQSDLKFPQKNKPENIYETPTFIGNFETFDELFDAFPPYLSAYSPALYIARKEGVTALEDEQQRDMYLVRMMYILLVKRLESSWFSFMTTVEKILIYHQSVLDKIKGYEKGKNQTKIEVTSDDISIDEGDEEYELGKKRPIRISEIEAAGKLKRYKDNLKEDIKALENLKNNLQKFKDEILKELESKKPNKSKDIKLEKLIEKINEKRKNAKNNGNKKILIFTAYKDTASYLSEQLQKRSFNNIAMVSGEGGVLQGSNVIVKNFEPILERFAPCTKLYSEQEWNDFKVDKELSLQKQYSEWLEWINKTDRTDVIEKLNAPIDILIATDCLSEGQNLQDCDYVVNFDIHWNPVRVIQRMGRIDRLNSPNDEIFGLNFWPSDKINDYLNLEERVVNRLISMITVGAEIDKSFVEKLTNKMDDDKFETQQRKRMLEQMQSDWKELETNDQQLGFNNLSLTLV